ncbi:hypothetical protein ACW9UR_07090 [Halovulum sp. GXIMD14794]
MTQLNLESLTRGEVRMLTGHQRGVSARDHFDLVTLEKSGDVIELVAPRNLDTVTPSFVQGFLAGSIARLGADGFSRVFSFEGLPNLIREDFEIGVERLIARQSKDKLESAD